MVLSPMPSFFSSSRISVALAGPFAKGYLMPYAKKSNEGLFIVKDFYYGYGQIAHHTLITPNGKLLFMRLASRIRESA